MSDLKWYAVWKCNDCWELGVTDNWQTSQRATKKAKRDHERRSPGCAGVLRIKVKEVKGFEK